jgi:hypothetical protein
VQGIEELVRELESRPVTLAKLARLVGEYRGLLLRLRHDADDTPLNSGLARSSG